jgi:hypothetical protein
MDSTVSTRMNGQNASSSTNMPYAAATAWMLPSSGQYKNGKRLGDPNRFIDRVP